MTEQDINLTELPKGWVWTRLVELTDIIQGQSPPSVTYNEEENGLPFYQGKLEFGDVYPLPQKWCTAPRKIAEKNDVLISVRAPVGPTNISPGRSCIGRGLAAIRGLGGIEPFFVLYLIRAHEQILSGQGTGTTFNAITGDKLRNLAIPLPPLPEQKRIVTKIEELFTRLDEGIAELKKVKLQLKRYRQSLLKSAFNGTLTADWRQEHKAELEPASVLLERIKIERKKNGKYKELPQIDTTDLLELPEGWTWARIGEIVEALQYGTSEKTNDDSAGIPVVRMGNIQEGKLIFDRLKYLPSTYPLIGELLLQDGDILFNRTNSSELVGKVAKYNNSQPRAIFASYLIRIKPNRDAYDPDFMTYFINSFYGRQYINSVVTQQVGQANVNGTKLAMMPVPFCALAEQQKIVEGIESCFSVADEIDATIEVSLKQSERLRQSILKQAFEGKLVPHDPEDEPADKLLERIKAEKMKINMNSKRGRAVNVR